jgi:hypothetical protein
MKARWLRNFAFTALVATAPSLGGCAYILHPERRGNMGGAIDGGMLVCDILWLLPGIIPGVVALIVDFSNGAIYVGGRYAVTVPADGHVAVRLPASPKPATLDVRLVAADRVIAHTSAVVGPDVPRHTVDLQLAAPPIGEQVYLEIVDASTAR